MEARQLAETEVETAQQQQQVEALRKVLAEVKADAQTDAPRYLEESRIPGGGE